MPVRLIRVSRARKDFGVLGERVVGAVRVHRHGRDVHPAGGLRGKAACRDLNDPRSELRARRVDDRIPRAVAGQASQTLYLGAVTVDFPGTAVPDFPRVNVVTDHPRLSA